MRLIYTLFFLVLFQFSGAQNEWKHSEITYTDALIQSKKENKPIFIMLYATWCPHCNVMKSTVFSDPKVMDFLDKNYISVWKDIEKEEGRKLKEQYQTKGLPAFIFIDSDETVLYSIKGEIKTDFFMYEAKNALNPLLQLPYLEKQFLADPSNANKCLAYIQTLRKGADRARLSEPTHLYLATQTDQQLASETNWRIIANGVSDIESREFKYVLTHKKDFENATSPARVERKIINIVSELLEPQTTSLDSITYFKNRAIAKTITLQTIDSLIFSYDLTLAERSENWGLYKRTTLNDTQKYVWNIDSKLKEIGQVYLKEIEDVSALNKAIDWAQRAIELNYSSDGNLLLSRLYLKINDKKSAEAYAQNARDIAVEMDWSTKEADDLLKEIKAV
ncbi:thioredoxin family protein [Flavobacterium sp. TAB 87]|uniref:thioredoxin family protein n=1 Tax=Flavobacterium sp. TAB 87 TaxID=1729581 RepID=UPI00076BE338|nr:thioredoxin family protein [Flavobacterium sp. TAB 87]KVV15231.1 thiol:disulfide interchange protein precursor [Flavobacterium sp. TAB 87]